MTRDRQPYILAALAVALFWAIEGIDVNAPQVERVAILVSAIVLGWATLRGSDYAGGLTAKALRGIDLRTFVVWPDGATCN